MAMWRCTNGYCAEHPAGCHVFDFESDVPVCPKCKTDGRTAEGRGVILKLETLHYDPPGRIMGRGKGRAACDAAKKVGTKGLRFTGDTAAVTCKDCRKSEVFKKHHEEALVYPEHDFQVEFHPDTGVVKSELK